MGRKAGTGQGAFDVEDILELVLEMNGLSRFMVEVSDLASCEKVEEERKEKVSKLSTFISTLEKHGFDSLHSLYSLHKS